MHPAVSEERQFVVIDGQKIAYIAVGNPANPPVLLVHGWLSHAGVWRQTLAQLQQHYYCISLDLLGHGYSDKPTRGDYSIAANAERVLKVAQRLGFDQFTYIGHSMGGMIGLHLAIHHPQRITRLVNVAGVVTGKLSLYILIVYLPILLVGNFIPSIWMITRFFVRFRWYREIFDRPIFYSYRPAYGDIDRQMALVKGIEVPAYQELAAIRKVNLADQLGTVQTPILTIFGKQDGTVPMSEGLLVKTCLPQSQLRLFDQCGHTPMVEQTDSYLDSLRAFLVTPG